MSSALLPGARVLARGSHDGALWADDFERFLTAREQALAAEIAKVTS